MSIVLLAIAFIIICYVIFPRIYLRGKKLFEKSSKKETSKTVTFCVGKKEEEPKKKEEPKEEKKCIVRTPKKNYEFTISKEEREQHELSQSIRERAIRVVLAEETNIPFKDLSYMTSMAECAYYAYNKQTTELFKVTWRQVDARINQLYSYMMRNMR